MNYNGAMAQILMRRATLADLPPLPVLPDGYRLRRAGQEDREALAALLAKAFPEIPWPSPRIDQELFDSPLGPCAVFVAAAPDGALAATATFLKEATLPASVGTVHWVGTDPAHRGKGLGEAVSLAALHQMAAQGCRSALLRTDPFRTAARALYRKLGFLDNERELP